MVATCVAESQPFVIDPSNFVTTSARVRLRATLRTLDALGDPRLSSETLATVADQMAQTVTVLNKQVLKKIFGAVALD